MGAKFDKPACASYLRQAQIRIKIHRQKQLTKIARTKDHIALHLQNGD